MWILQGLLISVVFVHSCICLDNYYHNGYGNNKYGTKTSYFWLHDGLATNSTTDDLMSVQFENRTCNAVQVNMVARHGARYTSVKDMHAFTALINKLQHQFGNSMYDFINSGAISYPESMAELLTETGKEEMEYLGSYYADEFNSLLKDAISRHNIYTAATRKTRTQESLVAFMKGVNKVLGSVYPAQTHIRDDTLRFYDNCPKYDELTADLSEQANFQHGHYFQNIVHNISYRMKLNTSLTVDDVKMMYLLCATELQIHGKCDWCTLQTDLERKVLEYDNDLQDYVKRLYGHAVTGEMSCPLARQIFTGMDSAITANDMANNYTKAIFQFGHSDTVIDFAAGLGLFKDIQPLTDDNYPQMSNRLFQSSTVDPFSTHMVFILYNCGDSGQENYAVKLLFNQKPMSIPACGADMCWYTTVRQAYSQAVDNCDHSRVCDPHQGAAVVG